jgi:hypothetical protein
LGGGTRRGGQRLFIDEDRVGPHEP